MKLVPLDLETAQRARRWRESCPESLRTAKPITEAQQAKWFERISKDPCERWWGIEQKVKRLDYHDIERAEPVIVGYTGLEHINWEAGAGEISLLIDPAYQGKHYGRCAVDEVLTEAAMTLNLHTVYGECYLCGPVQFWDKVVEDYDGYWTLLPDRKFWLGERWDGYYFSIPVWGLR